MALIWIRTDFGDEPNNPPDDPILRRARRGRHEDAANLTRTHSVGQIPSLHSGLDSHRTARSAICASLPRQRAPAGPSSKLTFRPPFFKLARFNNL